MGTFNENISLNLMVCLFSVMVLGGLLASCLFTGFWQRKSFYRAYLLTVATVMATLVLYTQTWVCAFYGNIGYQTVFFTLSDLISAFIYPCICWFLFCLAGGDRPLPRIFPILGGLLSLGYLIVEVLFVSFRGFTYNSRGILEYTDSFLPIASNVVIGILYAFLFVFLLYSARTLPKREVVVLLISLFIPVLVAVPISWNITPVYISYTFVLLILYQTICKRRDTYLIEQDLNITEKNYQLSESRIRLMVSQIQPHFLYNSLTAIANLCDTEPKRAKEITLDFSQYLSRNLKFMQEKEPVRFAQELEFIILYTNIERARFGDRLKMEYDIRTMEFSVPALTVQPLVENAIRHGVTVRPTGGTVWVITEERADCFAVIVRDDGVGFNQGEVDWGVSGDHYGIDYIRTRIREQMGGTLTVTSRPRRGTTAEITIPKEMSV